MVAVCLPRGIDLIVGIVGILRAGGAFVPIDAGYPAERIRYILEQTGAVHLVSTPDLAPAVLAHKPDLVLMDIHGACAGPLPPDLPPDPAGLNDLAYVIFTSGSTGLPKGVMVEHRSLAGIIRSQVKMFEITRHSRVLQMLSISFDAAVGEIFRTLTAGGTLYMADPDDLLPGPALVNLLKENRITAVAMSPTALGAMPDCSDDLPDLATITVGGEACPRTVAERWGKGRRLLNAYGPTETTIGATLAVNWDLSGKPPLGRPLPGVKVYVLDRQGHIAPVGTPGELYIGGIGVTRGYLNRPELTEKSFVPDPFSDVPGARMYRTGDLVRWLSTGMLDFLGRIDLQVKIRGFRIELGEIETALGKHPDIDHCTVNVYETGGVKRLIAYLVPRPGTDPSGLRTFLKQKLPEYMIPAFFMTVDKQRQSGPQRPAGAGIRGPRRRPPGHHPAGNRSGKTPGGSVDRCPGPENRGGPGQFLRNRRGFHFRHPPGGPGRAVRHHIHPQRHVREPDHPGTGGFPGFSRNRFPGITSTHLPLPWNLTEQTRCSDRIQGIAVSRE
jgi:amino acid adenylation domain-containing protein